MKTFYWIGLAAVAAYAMHARRTATGPDVASVYQAQHGRAPTQKEYRYWIGRPVSELQATVAAYVAQHGR